MSIESQEYGEGKKLIAGWIATRQIDLAADTYYVGMLLEYQADGTGVTTGTGNGTATAIVGDKNVVPGDYTLTFTAPLVADLTDPDGNVIAQGLTIADGDSTTFKIDGLTFTVNDGATAFEAADTIVMTIEATGTYVALADGKLAAIYNGTNGRILSSAGVDDCIMGGIISESGLVDASGDALTITKDQVARFAGEGFYLVKE